MPARIVMSRTLDLPADANLWNTESAPTIVMTQRGARQSFQSLLRSKGVEVVEFDFLTPENVADYCYERGFLQVRKIWVWRCLGEGVVAGKRGLPGEGAWGRGGDKGVLGGIGGLGLRAEGDFAGSKGVEVVGFDFLTLSGLLL